MEDTADYTKQSYWESRYKQEESYDWFASRYPVIIDLLLTKMQNLDPTSAKILHLGCGNSCLGVDLYQRGFRNIVNIDYSPIVIENMSAKYSQSMPEMTWVTMDVRDLKYEDEHFDLVVEKATMDTFQADKRSETLDEDIDKMLTEASRVLKPGCELLQMTWEIPYFRQYWTKREKYNWEVEYEKIGEDDMYMLYVYTKNAKSIAA